MSAGQSLLSSLDLLPSVMLVMQLCRFCGLGKGHRSDVVLVYAGVLATL